MRVSLVGFPQTMRHQVLATCLLVAQPLINYYYTNARQEIQGKDVAFREIYLNINTPRIECLKCDNQ